MKAVTNLAVLLFVYWLATALVSVTGVLTFGLFVDLTETPLFAAVVAVGAALTIGTVAYPASGELFQVFDKWFNK